MSKFSNFFKKFTKKNKKDQESNDEFYSDIESDDDFIDEDELEEYEDAGESTVIIKADELNEELIPHAVKAETQIPADSDLKFPDLPPEQTTQQDQAPPAPINSTSELDLGSLQNELDEIIDEVEDEENLVLEDEIITQEVEEDFIEDEFIEDEFIEDELLNEEDDVPLEELTIEQLSSEESEGEFIQEEALETEIPEQPTALQADDEVQNEVLEEDEEYEEFEDQEFEDEEENYSDQTATNTIDLNEEKLSLKDRFDHIKTRASDHFRKFNKKDLNKDSFKENADIPTHKAKLNNLKNRASSINWANIPAQFFNRTNRSKYHRYFQVSLAIICIYGVATLIGELLPGQKDYKSLSKRKTLNFDDSNSFTQSELNDLKSANVFRTGKVKAVKGPETNKKVEKGLCKTATRKSRANIKLINTIVLQDSVKSIASVQMRSSSKLVSIREGEKHQGVRIDNIQRLKLVVRNLNTQECETIENSKYKKTVGRNKISVLTPKASKQYKKTLKKIDGIENDGNDFKIDREFLKSKLSNINDVLTQARGIQINNPDGTISFKIVDIEPGGIFAYLGMVDNDIITQINGEPITELNAVMNIFGRISSLSSLNLTVKRNGEETKQNYNIK
jgi:type II secretory pathway component PulC